MTAPLDRRVVCLALLATSGLFVSRPASAQSKLFCRFSIDGGWTDEPFDYVTHKADPGDASGVPQIVRRLEDVLGFDASFDIYIAEREDNASAAIAGGRKILTIDVGFLEKLNRIARTDWAAISVIAHEVGHHIAGFSANRHRSELNADYWSGQALERLGSARSAASRAILAFGTDYDTDSHPNKHLRAETIERGWDDSSRGYVDYSFCLDCQ